MGFHPGAGHEKRGARLVKVLTQEMLSDSRLDSIANLDRSEPPGIEGASNPVLGPFWRAVRSEDSGLVLLDFHDVSDLDRVGVR